jgi:hypothetical protein
VTWEIETGAPNQLYTRGWTREDLPVGAEVIVNGYLSRDGSANVNGSTVRLVASGRELFAGSPGVGAPEPPR